jgi:hypothetical protein
MEEIVVLPAFLECAILTSHLIVFHIRYDRSKYDSIFLG